MPLKLVFNPDGSLKSKWWYGVYEINGRRKVHALGIRVKGKQIPTSLKEEGDRAFEDSRIRAQARPSSGNRTNVVANTAACSRQLRAPCQIASGIGKSCGALSPARAP